MQIRLPSAMVSDQESALRFYPTILGFVKKNDIPMSQYRWLTVSSPYCSKTLAAISLTWLNRRPNAAVSEVTLP